VNDVSQSHGAFLLDGTQHKAPSLAPGLYLTSTPIGNLADISLRALRTLAGAETIYCEDTRVTAKLTRNYGISTPLRTYHDHNGARVRPEILKRLQADAAIALVSDAGTPLVSDPGFKLVREAAEAGISVIAIPGPSAALCALAIAGLPTDRFHFAGFLPDKQGPRAAALADLARVPATLVLFLSPRRVSARLTELAGALGDRPAALTRELTKRHEECLRGRLSGLAEIAAEREPFKGEITLVVGPPEAGAGDPREKLDALLIETLSAMSVRDAASVVSAALALPRRDVYKRALELAETDSKDR